VQAPPAVVLLLVTYGYVPWSMSRKVPCAPSKSMSCLVRSASASHTTVFAEKRRDGLRGGEALGDGHLVSNRFGAQRAQVPVGLLDPRLEPLRKTLRVQQIARAQAHARGLVAIRRPNAASRRADLAFSPSPLPSRVERTVMRQREMAQSEMSKFAFVTLMSLFAQPLDFLGERSGIDHHAIANHAHRAFAQDAARNQVQHVFLPGDDDRVPALLPPCERTTTSARSVRTSMILPLPSSPHWAPTRIVLAMFRCA
jgi:hypothetical protein